MKKQYLFLMCALILASTAWGQVRETKYTELEIDKKMGSNYQIISADSLGVLCVLESTKYEEGNRKQMVFTFYDSNLEKSWEQVYSLKTSATLLEYYFDGKFIYTLIEEKEFEYAIMKLSLADGIISQIAITDIDEFSITHFKASNGTLLLGGMVNGKPAVILKKYEEGNKPIALPSINQLKATLLDIVIDKENDKLVVIMENERAIDGQSLYVNWYDLDGNIRLNREIELSKDFNLLTYRPHLKSDGSLLLFGSFGLKNERLAQGIYSMTIKDGKMLENRFYDFGYLKNFFNYYPEKKRKKKIKKIKEKLEEDNKTRLAYKLFTHELDIQDDRIVFSAEAYEAQSDFSRDQNWTRPSSYGSSIQPTFRRPALGIGGFSYMPSAFSHDAWWGNNPAPTNFEYTHAFALGFDLDGKLLWDNSFNYNNNTESDFPIELAQVISAEDTTVFFQYERENYYFKKSYKSDYQEENNELETPLPKNGDIIDNLDHGGVMRWYGNHYLVSGIKNIRNKVDNELKREVFFVSKFTFNPAWVDKKKSEGEEGEKEEKPE